MGGDSAKGKDLDHCKPGNAETIREAAVGRKGTSGMMVVHRETSRGSRWRNGWGGGGIGGRCRGRFRRG